MFVRDACDNCGGRADVGLRDEPVRLSIRIWTCANCAHQNVTAYDWERDEMVDAEVFSARENMSYAERQRLRRHDKKQRRAEK